MFNLLPKKMIVAQAEKGINEIVKGFFAEVQRQGQERENAIQPVIVAVEVSPGEDRQSIEGEILPLYKGEGANAGHFIFAKGEGRPVDLETVFLPPQAVSFVKNMPGLSDMPGGLYGKLSEIICQELESRGGANAYIFPDLRKDAKAPKWTTGRRQFNRVELENSFSLIEIVQNIDL
jgi:hypothetical protein